MDESQKANAEIFNQIPKPKGEVVFNPIKIEDVNLPHPYCITPKHLEYADSMYLNNESIKRAESKGAVCDICRQINRKGEGQILSIDEHITQKTLFIEIPSGISDLNAIEGLHAYLLSIKDKAVELGVQGFAFPSRKEQ